LSETARQRPDYEIPHFVRCVGIEFAVAQRSIWRWWKVLSRSLLGILEVFDRRALDPSFYALTAEHLNDVCRIPQLLLGIWCFTTHVTTLQDPVCIPQLATFLMQEFTLTPLDFVESGSRKD
jgi:hypothetical protein